MTALVAIPDEHRFEVERTLAINAMEIFQKEGASAFEMPREAAAIHEAGHCIIGKLNGFKIKKVSIFEKTLPAAEAAFRGYDKVWYGRTEESPQRRWEVGPSANASDDLKRAQFVIAGLAVEAMSQWKREGSSLDELALSQLIAAEAARKLGVDAKQLWNSEVWKLTILTCRHNLEVIDKIADRLLKVGSITGSVLGEMLNEVKSLPAGEEVAA